MSEPVDHSPRSIPQVMVSSTFTDLKDHRQALFTVLNQHGLHPHVMENDSGKPDGDVIDSSLRMVRESAAYALVISHKYGQTPKCTDRNPSGLSLTELEFNEAQRLNRPTLLFLMGDDHSVKKGDIESDPAKQLKLDAFRERAKKRGDSEVERVYAVFESLEDFKAKLPASLHKLANLLKKGARGDEMETGYKQYDVVLSFAGEDRPYVEQVAVALRSIGIKVFYDRFEQVHLWGKDLYDYLREIYSEKALFCVMFISKHYCQKQWTNHERQSAQIRAIKSSSEYILPVRFDDSVLPGLSPNAAYLDLADITPQQLASMVVVKVRSCKQKTPRTVAELRRHLEQVKAELDESASDSRFPIDDPLRYRACPKCGSEKLIRELSSDADSEPKLVYVVCTVRSCAWSQAGKSTAKLAEVVSVYPDVMIGNHLEHYRRKVILGRSAVLGEDRGEWRRAVNPNPNP